MAVLTADQRRKAARWWVREALKKPGKEAGIDRTTLFTALDNLNDWFDTAPSAAPATNQAAVRNAIPAAFKAGTDVTQEGYLLSAVALARAGEFG